MVGKKILTISGVNHMELHTFFLMLAVILLSARFLAEFGSRFGVPAVIGELAAGLIFGPSILGWLEPSETLKILAEIGIILLLFEVGMDTDIYRLAKAGSKPVVVAGIGFALPFLAGYAVSAYVFDLPMLASLFVGGTLTATSIGITVRVLSDLGRRSSDEAQVVIGAAVLDDILGVIALAFLYQFAVLGQVTVASIGQVSLFILIFMLLAPVAAKAVAWVIDHFDRKSESPGLLVTMVVSLIMIFSYVAHAVGAPAIMGGFAAGVALGQGFKLRLGGGSSPLSALFNRVFSASPELTHRLEGQFRPLVHLFSPIFFVMVGVSLDLKVVDFSSPFVWWMAFAMTVVAILGKWLAGFFIRESRLRQSAIGLCMIPRGEVGLIFAQLGYQQGLLALETYATLLIVIALTTALPPFALKWYYGKWGDRTELAG